MPENLKTIYSDGFITENVYNELTELFSIIGSVSNAQEVNKKVIIFENNLLTSKSLITDEEKKCILAASAIARYSSAYWQENNYTGSKGWLGALSDIVGAAIMFPGGPGMMFLGAATCSYSAAALGY